MLQRWVFSWKGAGTLERRNSGVWVERKRKVDKVENGGDKELLQV